MNHEAAWQMFEKCGKGMISLKDVPFPSMGEIQQVDEAGFKKLAKRWHPDKFLQRFGDSLYPSDKEKICEKVKQVFQGITNARQAARAT